MITQRRSPTDDLTRDLNGGLVAVGIEVNRRMGRLQAEAQADTLRECVVAGHGLRQRVGHGLIHLGVTLQGVEVQHHHATHGSRAG